MDYLDLINKAVNIVGSQSSLADKLGISRQAVNEWGKGGTFPKKYRKKICQILGIDIKELEGCIEIQKGINFIGRGSKVLYKYYKIDDIKDMINRKINDILNEVDVKDKRGSK